MRSLALLVATLLLSSPTLAADVELSHQGRLLDSAGAPLEGQHELTFSLYTQALGGSPVWSESQSVTLSNGIYSAALGSVAPLSDTLFDDALWLQIGVSDEDFDAPRQFLHAVPFAVRAQRVVGSVTLTPSDADCDADAVGALQFDADSMTVQFCDGNGWLPLGGDGIPDAFSIPAAGAAPGGLAVSPEVTLTGYDVPVRVTVSGDGNPQVSIDRGPWSSSGSLPVAGTLEVRATTPSVSGQSRSIQVVAGGTSTIWTATAGDVVPDPFTVPPGVALAGEVATSSGVQLSGYEYPIPVSISGAGNPQISVDGGPWSTSTTLPVGATLRARATVPGSNGQVNTATITAGGVTSPWTARAGYDEAYLKTVETPVGVMTFTFAANSSESCDSACSRRGLSCDQSELNDIHSYARANPGFTETFYPGTLGLQFSPGGTTIQERRVSHPSHYIGLGCYSSTWTFSGFGNPVTGCNFNEVSISTDGNMTCGQTGYNNGNFSGPRLCPCN